MYSLTQGRTMSNRLIKLWNEESFVYQLLGDSGRYQPSVECAAESELYKTD